ncbi:hypothetical protein [Absidia glauca]|uniref:Uncharacterized protein n=1 Tax=Absidia glauca TaxID=4829 RepID=A0A163TJP2_ABSGL|nr:hypothetical protein [Absidia glauca]
MNPLSHLASENVLFAFDHQHPAIDTDKITSFSASVYLYNKPDNHDDVCLADNKVGHMLRTFSSVSFQLVKGFESRDTAISGI